MNMIDPSEWGRKTADILRGLLSPFEQRLKRLEDMPAPENGAPGQDGQDGKDGRDGVDGKDGQDGAPGRDGQDGQDGAPGRGPTSEEIEKAVAAYLKANPPANGKDGERGPQGEMGAKGADGRDGRDGLPGGAGANGKDGRDGFSLNDLDLSLAEDGRTVVLRFASGEFSVEKRLKLATVLDRGVYKAGTTYEAGDAVSFGGNMWIAQCETMAKPGESQDFRLAVKKGRDGKDGSPGERGPVGAKGENGRDLTRMLPSGEKY